MKISKLFHWLYAILMFMPFIAYVFNLVRFGLGNDNTLYTWSELSAIISFPNFGGLSQRIFDIYNYMFTNLFGMSGTFRITICNCFTYWTIISLGYLIFDVIMYVPLLVHRWIDKARLE